MLEIELIQVALGIKDSLSRVPSQKEWDAIYAFAERHGIMGVLFGGIERLGQPRVSNGSKGFQEVSSGNKPSETGEAMKPSETRCLPPMDLLMDWLGQAEYQKTQYEEQRKAVDSLVALWEAAGLHVVELKGNSIGQYYPRPELRYSCDFDCFLLKTKTEKTAFASATSAPIVADANGRDFPCEQDSQIKSQPSSSAEAKVKNIASLKNNVVSGYEDGNLVVEAQGVTVNREFYKNSSFMWKGLHVENHQFCCPVRGNKRMKRFERVLRSLLVESVILRQAQEPKAKESTTSEPFRTTVGELVEPQNHSEPKTALAQFNALFLMEHMWAHFFEEALTMKQVLDWVVFRKECSKDVDWQAFESAARDCGFWEFACAMNKIVDNILNHSDHSEPLNTKEARLWQSILQGGGTIEMNNGWSTRFQLIGNYFRNSWKYRYFAPHGALYTLARTSIAYIFDKNPKI